MSGFKAFMFCFQNVQNNKLTDLQYPAHAYNMRTQCSHYHFAAKHRLPQNIVTKHFPEHLASCECLIIEIDKKFGYNRNENDFIGITLRVGRIPEIVNPCVNKIHRDKQSRRPVAV
ncbi:unnamed protein product [Parnassius mnemosyne]|uniref:Uncharacterized protein n=1 Tax=Parnassius mnemosyne TaxID=213953 RepID=A0AAV1LLE0_9NEOP